MRTGSLKRRWRAHGRKAGAAVLLILAGLLVLGTGLVVRHFRPMVMELALSEATDNITVAINQTVSRLMLEGEVDYQNLVILEKDNAGNVTALSTNIAGINLLQATVTSAIVEYFADADLTPVSIPVGNLLGGALLSGRGPRIKVELLSVSNVRTSFRNEFTSAGINQTRHRIIMDVEVSFGILLSGRGEWESVLTEVNVAETVIVGTVPGTYAEIGEGALPSA